MIFVSSVIIGICGFSLICGIVSFIFCFRFYKKKKNKFAIILAVVGLLLFIPTTYLIYSIVSYTVKNNTLLEYEYTKEFTQINYGFSERFVSGKKTVIGINIEINGFINGKGELLVKPDEKADGIILKLERNIDEEIKNRDWYIPECIIEFIPDNEFVEGKILIKINMY